MMGMKVHSFEEFLRQQKRSANTLRLYTFAVKQFSRMYGRISTKNLQQYKLYLIEHYKPRCDFWRLRVHVSVNY